jgi:hypothetical protein
MTVGMSALYIIRTEPHDLKVFDRILADSGGDLINLCRVNVTSPAAFVDFY